MFFQKSKHCPPSEFTYMCTSCIALTSISFLYQVFSFFEIIRAGHMVDIYPASPHTSWSSIPILSLPTRRVSLNSRSFLKNTKRESQREFVNWTNVTHDIGDYPSTTRGISTTPSPPPWMGCLSITGLPAGIKFSKSQVPQTCVGLFQARLRYM